MVDDASDITTLQIEGDEIPSWKGFRGFIALAIVKERRIMFFAPPNTGRKFHHVMEFFGKPD